MLAYKLFYDGQLHLLIPCFKIFCDLSCKKSDIFGSLPQI